MHMHPTPTRADELKGHWHAPALEPTHPPTHPHTNTGNNPRTSTIVPHAYTLTHLRPHTETQAHTPDEVREVGQQLGLEHQEEHPAQAQHHGLELAQLLQQQVEELLRSDGWVGGWVRGTTEIKTRLLG